MKRIISVLISVVLIALLSCGCGAEGGTKNLAESEAAAAESSGLDLHKIGVAVYNVSDAEVRMFKGYLDNYIKGCFSDVTFIYSDSISSEDEIMAFYAQCAKEGVEGIMAFLSYDLEKEVKFCADNNMYYIRPNGTSRDTEFARVANNPYFVGEIGPGKQLEGKAAEEMTRALASKDGGQNYVVLSGGAAFGNEMHRLRTVAILETLEEICGASLGKAPEDIAESKEAAVFTLGSSKVAFCPGLLRFAEYGGPASDVVKSGEYDVILSTLPVTPIKEAIDSVNVKCGVIDCFSEDNMLAFNNGRLAYVAGKYESEIGPGFAALYNAITGSGDVLRASGQAFRLVQGFWNAASREEYDAMYGLATGASVNAYNYEDLYSVIRSINSEADYEAFRNLTGSWKYEECLARRSE